MKDKTLITICCVSVLLIIGLIILSNMPTIGGSFGYGMPRPSKEKSDPRLVVTDAPAQVVYRIDKDRFLTLENYIACDKSGQIYYNDTAFGIRTRIETVTRTSIKKDGAKIKDFYPGDDQIQLQNVQNGIMAYRGILLHDKFNGILVFPYVNKARTGCDNNRGGAQGAFVSVDGGRTFYIRDYERSFDYPTLSTVVTVGEDAYFVGDDYDYGVKKVPFDYSQPVTENSRIKFDKELLKGRENNIRLHCDNNIKPSKIRFVKYSYGEIK